MRLFLFPLLLLFLFLLRVIRFPAHKIDDKDEVHEVYMSVCETALALYERKNILVAGASWRRLNCRGQFTWQFTRLSDEAIHA